MNIGFVTFETLMFKPKGRAHSNVFIHLHKHHLSRCRQLLKQRKFSSSRRGEPISRGPAVVSQTRSVFKCNGHFFQVVHFQEKLLEVQLWVSLLSSKSQDGSTRKKGPIRDHLAKKLSIAFTLVLFALLLTSSESKGGFSDGQKRVRRHAALSSSIVKAQVPVSADHFNQLNATDTACCYEAAAQFKEAHRWVTLLRRLFPQTSAANKCYGG
ncbi:hypothetical protein GOODEAATRI_011502 [Goodea atripinnis]|uniref:Uncharacterized protein n=1 Tax=Goodea atripinnis TaxID=208336 RepID=A0ABV0MT86_9TELE